MVTLITVKTMVALRKFQNLIELLTYFREEQTCRDYLELIRWNGKIVCPYKECKGDHVFKYTDGLARIFKHQYINHGQGEYAKDGVHTNSIEGFWSLLKRGVVGIYHSMSDKHLQKYIDEFVFRYNTRQMSENFRFDSMLNNINTHLTYKQLCLKK